LRKKGNYTGAEPLYRRALEAQERILGPEHPETLSSMTKLADLLEETNRFEEAFSLHHSALEIQERKRGAERPDTIKALNHFSYSLRKHGHASKSEPIDRKVVEGTMRVSGEVHPLTIHRRNNLVLSLIMLGKLAEARQVLATNWRLGGIGKSVLAAALARNRLVRQAYPDGVVWISCGQKLNDEDLLKRQRDLAKHLGGDVTFGTLEQGKGALRQLLSAFASQIQRCNQYCVERGFRIICSLPLSRWNCHYFAGQWASMHPQPLPRQLPCFRRRGGRNAFATNQKRTGRHTVMNPPA